MNLLWKRVKDLSVGQILRLAPGAVIHDEKRLVPAGSTLRLDPRKHSGKLIALDTASGSVCTLPAATGSGNEYEFIVTVAASTNAHIVKVGVAADQLAGGVMLSSDNASNAILGWEPATNDDQISLNGSTTGGKVGDRFTLVDIKAGYWAINGRITESGAETTPFSNAVT